MKAQTQATLTLKFGDILPIINLDMARNRIFLSI